MSYFNSRNFSFAPAKRIGWVGPLLLASGEVNRIPLGVPGVYLLHQFSAELGAYPVFYAGKSNDLRRRLTEHLSDVSSKVSIWWLRHEAQAYFSAAPVMDDTLRDCIEAGLILGLQPPCNDQCPTAEPIFVGLPPLRV